MGYRNRSGKVGYTYILSNYKRTVFYIGVTDNIENQIRLHRSGKGSKFTAKYKLKYLMYLEEFPNIGKAIQREKQLKNCHRKWKIDLIKQSNLDMVDLAANL